MVTIENFVKGLIRVRKDFEIEIVLSGSGTKMKLSFSCTSKLCEVFQNGKSQGKFSHFDLPNFKGNKKKMMNQIMHIFDSYQKFKILSR